MYGYKKLYVTLKYNYMLPFNILVWNTRLHPIQDDVEGGQKRPTQVSKETYTSVKRDLHPIQDDVEGGQKRPTLVSKETYTSVKRDLHPIQDDAEECFFYLFTFFVYIRSHIGIHICM